MYWSRTGINLDFASWLVLWMSCWAGGWLLCTHVFRLRLRERLYAGMGLGWLLSIVLTDLLARALPIPAAFWGASVLILCLGLLAAWQAPPGSAPSQARLPWRDWLNFPAHLTFGAVLWLFALINRGLAIFDEFLNLPLISWMAAGKVPPTFYLNPGIPLDYHYGLHLFAAGLVRVGGLFPWSAFDLVKAASIALTLQLAVLWLQRTTRSRLMLTCASLVVLFAGGTRWLLLFVPKPTLSTLSASVEMLGSARSTAPDLTSAITRAWNIEGLGPFPFPFAFANGIFTPLSLAMGSSGALLTMTVLLLLLLGRPKWSSAAGLLYGFVLASLALTGEHLFVMVWAGFFLAAIITWLRQQKRLALSWTWVLLSSAVLSLLMGGVLSAMLWRVAARLLGNAAAGSLAMPEVGLRWPPAILSSHLGALSVTSLYQVAIALVEAGPVLWLSLPATWAIARRLRSGKLALAGLGSGAVIGFLGSMVVKFSSRERDLSRMISAALVIWLLSELPGLLFMVQKRRKRWFQPLIGAGGILAMVSGIALLPGELIAMARPQLTYYVSEVDAQMSRLFWNQLEPGAWVLDPGTPVRPTVLFGRGTGPAFLDAYTTTPEFKAMMANPAPAVVAQAGYSFLYLDQTTWQRLEFQYPGIFEDPCIQNFAELTGVTGEFRRLLDVRGCQFSSQDAINPP